MNSSRRSYSTADRARQRADRGLDNSRKQSTTFFTIAEVAESLKVCPRTVRRWIDSKALVAHEFGRLIRISRADLAAFVAAYRSP